MAAPFGGHPTLEGFLEWAIGNGCQSSTGFLVRSDGRPYEVLQIVNPKGGSVVVVEPDLSERLAPSVVTNYQRRLGIKSQFATLPEHPTSAVYDQPDV